MKSLLLLRADAGCRMGTGHVMRCLALAQAWQDAGGRAVFALAGESLPLENRLESEGCPVERLTAEAGSESDARQTTSIARRLGAEWVVVDGYQFGSTFQRVLKDEG